jgi:hypothetical protein
MSEVTEAQRLAILAASGGTVGTVAVAQMSTDTQITVTGIATTNGKVIAEFPVNFDEVAGGVGVSLKVACSIDWSDTRTGADFGNFIMRVGATAGGTPGGTIEGTFGSIGSTARRLDHFTSAAFNSPGGTAMVQLCAGIANTSSTDVTLFSGHFKVGAA